MSSRTALIFFAGLLAFSCNKENAKGCWQGFDPSAGDIPGLLLCDQTRAEAESQHPGYWFYEQGEAKFCWAVQAPTQTFYMRHIPLSMVDKMRPYSGHQYTRVDCNSFCIWEWTEKVQHKQTGQYGPTSHSWDTMMADSCSKLYVGRIIVTRETADSIYRREFVKQMP